METVTFLQDGTRKQSSENSSPANQKSYHEYGFIPLEVAYESKSGNGESNPVTIVNTAKFGKRVTFEPTLIENIGSPTAIQIAVNEAGIAISATQPEDGTSFVLRKSAKRPCVYSSHLVDALTDRFDLNFDGRTSISFSKVEYLDRDGVPTVFVQLGQAEQEDEPASTELGLGAEIALKELGADFPKAAFPAAEISSDDELDPAQEDLAE